MGTNKKLDPKPIFTLRFGSISVTVGAAVSHHMSALKSELSLRNVRPIDATFLTSTSRGTSCNIIQLMSTGELTLETLTADAEKESQNVWSSHFNLTVLLWVIGIPVLSLFL